MPSAGITRRQVDFPLLIAVSRHPDHFRVAEESMIDRSWSTDSILAAHLSITAPPATSSTTPVIQPASPDARKTAADATSSGVPRRLSG
jgi:hypothetical protein